MRNIPSMNSKYAITGFDSPPRLHIKENIWISTCLFSQCLSKTFSRTDLIEIRPCPFLFAAFLCLRDVEKSSLGRLRKQWTLRRSVRKVNLSKWSTVHFKLKCSLYCAMFRVLMGLLIVTIYLCTYCLFHHYVFIYLFYLFIYFDDLLICLFA